MYGVMPSELLSIDDPYVAFCFNEACAYIRAEIEAGKTPRYKSTKREKVGSFKELYENITQ